MPCNWSTAANILRGVAHRHSGHYANTQATRTRQRWSLATTSPLAFSRAAFPSTSTTGRASVALAASDLVASSNATVKISPDSLASMSLTSAQLSRASAQAVRLCVREGHFGDAFYLVNSLRLSVQSDPADREKGISRFIEHQSQLLPINFGRPVSPRLAAHALLHGLVRAGFTTRAAKYAELLFENGVRIRLTTMELIVSSLTSIQSNSYAGQALHRPQNLHESDVLSLRLEEVVDPCSRAAVSLLHEARRWGHQRSKRMYQNIISTCLLQGEIIVASLLFVLLVKDWELRRALTETAHATSTERDNPQYEMLTSFGQVPHSSLLHAPYPSMSMLKDILEKINSRFQRNPTDGADTQISLQALANLAMLLDTGQLCGSAAGLIKSLYSCPRSDNWVWIRTEQGDAQRVPAYRYFHDVLERLLQSLKSPEELAQSSSKSPPKLDRRSYNALLFYALRHRLSPAHATRVLEHMLVHRDSPLELDTVTINTLIRSGTLLRRIDISEQALQALRTNVEDFRSGRMGHPNVDYKSYASYQTVRHTVPDTQSHSSKDVSSLSAALRKLKAEEWHTPESFSRRLTPLRPDASTVSSYVTHLVSTGHGQILAGKIFDILPEMRIVDHPSWGALTNLERTTLYRMPREEALRRAVTYGPYSFTAILNALAKAGQTGLTERVWLLAKQAERASWVPDFVPGVRPWVLPVHAYTIMMQCYADGVRKSLNTHSGRWANLDLTSNDEHGWAPAERNHVGWAQFVVAKRRVESKEARRTRRKISSGRIGYLLYKAMLSGGLHIYRSLIAMQPTADQQASEFNLLPDARFFNAALCVFGRHPYAPRRGPYRNPAYWRRRLRERYAAGGTRSKLWTPYLQEIAEGMVEAGFSIPVGFREAFIGRWPPGTQHTGQPLRTLYRRPYAFGPVRQRFRPHRLFTAKTRGLPVRRRDKGQRTLGLDSSNPLYNQ